MTARWSDHTSGRSGAARQLDWADGYVVETPYFEPVTIDVTPAWLSMVSVFHGQPPLDLTRPLTWMDLGAASGISACVVAASNPTADVWGFDHNPGHVERGRRLATAASLPNCRFEEASFAQLAADESIGPAEADVIVVSGVYSWVSRANQHHIAEVVRRRLRPGGLAYVMYETSTGWSTMVPVAEALRLVTEVDGRRPDLAFHDAAATISRLADTGAGHFPLPGPEAKFMGGWAEANPQYAAHEYLGSHFGPLMFDDVAAVMADARCTYLGNLDAADHLAGFWAPPSLVDRVSGTTDVVTRELLRDLIGQRALRRDLWRRGVGVVPPLVPERDLRTLTFCGLEKAFDATPVELPTGNVSLDPVYYEPLVGALRSHPLDVATVLGIHTEWRVGDAVAAMALLVAGGHATPAPPAGSAGRAAAGCRRLNEVLVGEDLAGAEHSVMASPVLGAGVDLDLVGLLAVGHLFGHPDADVDALTDHVMSTLDAQGRAIRADGAVVLDETEARAIATERIDRAVRLAARLGITSS